MNPAADIRAAREEDLALPEAISAEGAEPSEDDLSPTLPHSPTRRQVLTAGLASDNT